jgi:hypothetical protein
MDSERGEFFFLTWYDRDVTIYHYKVVTNLVFLNYIPHLYVFIETFQVTSLHLKLSF